MAPSTFRQVRPLQQTWRLLAAPRFVFLPASKSESSLTSARTMLDLTESPSGWSPPAGSVDADLSSEVSGFATLSLSAGRPVAPPGADDWSFLGGTPAPAPTSSSSSFPPSESADLGASDFCGLYQLHAGYSESLHFGRIGQTGRVGRVDSPHSH
jgi:hypothetical protein